MADGDAFCGECGARVTEKGTVQRGGGRPCGNGPLWIVLIAVAVCAAIAAACLLPTVLPTQDDAATATPTWIYGEGESVLVDPPRPASLLPTSTPTLLPTPTPTPTPPPSDAGTEPVYWTDASRYYHASTDCPACDLSDAALYTGTPGEAAAMGCGDPCPVCAGGAEIPAEPLTEAYADAAYITEGCYRIRCQADDSYLCLGERKDNPDTGKYGYYIRAGLAEEAAVFRAVDRGDGQCMLYLAMPLEKEFVLDIWNAAREGSGIDVWSVGKPSDQTWIAERQADGTYLLRVASRPELVAVLDQSINGVDLTNTAPADGSPWQKWVFLRAEDVD